VTIDFSDGQITQFWNMLPQDATATGPNSNWQITLFDLQPQQTYTGSGFTWRISLAEWDSLENDGDEQGYAAPYSITYISTAC